MSVNYRQQQQQQPPQQHQSPQSNYILTENSNPPLLHHLRNSSRSLLNPTETNSNSYRDSLDINNHKNINNNNNNVSAATSLANNIKHTSSFNYSNNTNSTNAPLPPVLKSPYASYPVQPLSYIHRSNSYHLDFQNMNSFDLNGSSPNHSRHHLYDGNYNNQQFNRQQLSPNSYFNSQPVQLNPVNNYSILPTSSKSNLDVQAHDNDTNNINVNNVNTVNNINNINNINNNDDNEINATKEEISIKNEATKKLLSTSSPEAIKVALRITPSRLANLLIRKGPLPIRHITSQLAIEVPGFDLLSLSKQRRLIMAVMEQTDQENNVVFEKIGWGQWAVRKIDSDYIITEGTDKDGNEGSTNKINQNQNSTESENNKISVHDLRSQSGLKLGWTKKQQNQNSKQIISKSKTGKLSSKSRRESITNSKSNLHNVKLPNEPLNDSNAIASDSEDDFAFEDEEDADNADEDEEDQDEEDSDDDEDEDEDDDAIDQDSDAIADEEALFTFDQDENLNSNSINRFKRSPPIKFANRVPLKISPPPPGSNNSGTSSRRRSSSSVVQNSIGKNTHSYNHHNQSRQQFLNRSRLNSIENMDNYIMSSAKNSSVSINSPPPSASHAILASAAILPGSPNNPWNSNYIHHNNNQNADLSPDSIAAAMSSAGRRKSSFNESHLRSTLSSSLPKPHLMMSSPPSNGPSLLLKPPYDHSNSTPSVHHKQNNSIGLAPPASTARNGHGRHHNGNQSDTDEEDWATIGAESLRRSTIAGSNNDTFNKNSTPALMRNYGELENSKSSDSDETTAAAFALVDLMSV